ncbi:6783_t:CDS:2 [Paraglomus brasilianum]|uniref:6783_t:CDS:1 n=1 Tax=Paraglomus brasilianum TaxID=144538 RepID=A0A9N8VC35_9GLOM|nr:6783_t:CDS:2 [Paraglomus brasilianum]
MSHQLQISAALKGIFHNCSKINFATTVTARGLPRNPAYAIQLPFRQSSWKKFLDLCSPNGVNAFTSALVCPACETTLTENDDIVFIELNPSEDYKLSVLSGLRPDIIMEIATRALSFWTYQTTQEACFQEMMYRDLQESCQKRSWSWKNEKMLKSPTSSKKRVDSLQNYRQV